MAEASWLTSALSAADAATQALGMQEPVSHEAFIFNSGGFGGGSYAAAVTRTAMVQRKEGKLRTDRGQELSFKAVVSFVRPVPVHPRDKITLSDGFTGPIIEPQGGLADATTGRTFLRTVHLG